MNRNNQFTMLDLDRVFLAFVFLIPLLPRPTALGPERWVVPVLMSLLIAVWIFGKRISRPKPGGNLQLLAMILGFPIAAFVFRVVIQGQLPDELPHIISRILFAIGLFSIVHWLNSTSLPRKTVFKFFLMGFLASSILTIFCGFTGIQILEEDSIKPSRFLGLHKSTGIFRSFGEFGIMGCIAWTYLVIYARDIKVSFWLLSAGTVLMALLIAQSRNIYLAWTITTVLATCTLFLRIPKLIYAILGTSIVLLPIVVAFSIPLLQETSFGNKLIGTGTILETNVDVRFDQFSDAFTLISKDPGSSLLGYSRQAWRDLMMESHGNLVAPHNHFLSTLVFTGLVGGGVWIIGLFVLPSIMLARDIHLSPLVGMSFIALIGSMVGLSFYEGFFSAVVMFTIAMAWSVGFNPTDRSYGDQLHREQCDLNVEE